MINRSLNTIAESDLFGLVENQVAESGILDFKLSLPSGSDRDKAEFVKDVAGMANANGGDLIFGVEEEGGIAIAVPGVACVNPEAERNRLTQLIEGNTDPKLTQFEIGSVTLATGQRVFIVRVEPSLGGPFRISVGAKPSGFPKRLGTTTIHMDVFQIREDVMRASSALEKLDQFRSSRMKVLSRQYSRKPRVPGIYHQAMEERRLHYPTVVVHAVPMAAVRGTSGPLDPRGLLSRWSDIKLLRDRVISTTHRFNHLGLLVSDSNDRIARTQIFRDGRIEQTMVLTETSNDLRGENGEQYEQHNAIFDLPLTYLETRIVETTRENMDFLADFDISTPFLVGVSLLNSDHLRLVVGKGGFQDEAFPCEAKEIHCELSEIHVPEELDIGLRFAFNHLWNAYGFASSPNYDDQGRLRV